MRVQALLNQGGLAVVFVTLLLSALATEFIGIHTLFGAFLMGIGFGLLNTTYIVAIQTSVSWSQRGVATSTTSMPRARLCGTIPQKPCAMRSRPRS